MNTNDEKLLQAAMEGSLKNVQAACEDHHPNLKSHRPERTVAFCQRSGRGSNAGPQA